MKHLIVILGMIFLFSSCREKAVCVCKLQAQFPDMKVYAVSSWNYIVYNDSTIYNYKPTNNSCENNKYIIIKIK